VFRRFYRVDKQHSQNEIKGTGLGLSIVKRAIEAHQGRIVASSTPGSETKFLMTVPLAGPKPDSVELDSQIPLFKE
jgi:signal transduction histidine kinase